MTLSNNNLLTMYTFMLKLQCYVMADLAELIFFWNASILWKYAFFMTGKWLFVIRLQQDEHSQSETQNIVWLVCNFNKIQNNSVYGKIVETFFEHAQASTSAN